MKQNKIYFKYDVAYSAHPTYTSLFGSNIYNELLISKTIAKRIK